MLVSIGHVDGRVSRTESKRTSSSPDQPHLRLVGLTKRFDGVTVVDELSLDVRPGEMFGLLGPSGCGKTTTLRMIAGLEPVDEGAIRVADRVVVDTVAGVMLAPEKRNMGMVFQSYAIWPHMTVFQNVAFPLRLRRTSRKKTRELVEQILEFTGLDGLAERSAMKLSGGQQQRVALARALVYRPSLLLLDEPLSNLDANLREQMRRELRQLQQELEVTVVFVTHDQSEAMSLSDRMAVMNAGRVEQIGTPAQLYEHPSSPFVRDFLGHAVALDGVLHRGHRGVRVEMVAPGEGELLVLPDTVAEEIADGQRVRVVCRPEDIAVMPGGGPPGPNQLAAQVLSLTYLGDRIEYQVQVGRQVFLLWEPRRHVFEAGSRVLLQLDPEAARVWPG